MTESGTRISSRFRAIDGDGCWATRRSGNPNPTGFNLYSRRKLEEKLTYMHHNPVVDGLVREPCQWRWSSARYYELGRSVGVEVGGME